MSDIDLEQMERDWSFYPVRNDSPRRLAPQQIEQFNERGYLKGINIFDAAGAEANRRFFDDLIARVFAADDGRDSYSINGYQTSCRGIYDLAVHPLILDCVEDLLGPDVISWGTHFFCKLPGDVKEVSWHQDAAYWPLTPSKTVTAWLAIDDADRENGCMKVIGGSHRLGKVPLRDSTPEDQNVLSQEVIDAEQYGDVDFIELKAGQISLHADMLIHGSDPNLSNRRRCGLTLRYVPPDVRGTWNTGSIICRGSDPSGHWANIQRPDGDSP